MDLILFDGLNVADNTEHLIPNILVEMKALCLRVEGTDLLNEFNLRVGESQRIGITGPSGCGKTTLLRSIIKRNPPKGSGFEEFVVRLNDQEPIGYSPQASGLLPWYSLRRNLLNVAVGNATKQMKDASVAEIAEVFGLSKQLDEYPNMLSGGEAQRGILAGSIILQPRVFLADEPLTEVDLAGKWTLLRYWSKKIMELHAALVLVSHDVDVLLYLCDEIIVLEGKPGRIVQRFFATAPHPRQKEDMISGNANEIRKSLMSGSMF